MTVKTTDQWMFRTEIRENKIIEMAPIDSLLVKSAAVL